jgi:homoserine kinase type II
MQHLAERGLSLPPAGCRATARCSASLQGGRRRSSPSSRACGRAGRRAQHCREVGKALAEMHLAGRRFQIARERAVLSGWRPLWDKAARSRRRGGARPSATRLRRTCHLEANWPNDLPAGVIHADLFPDNVFFLGDDLSGLIDFYFACNDLLAYDVAICLNAWCFERIIPSTSPRARR